MVGKSIVKSLIFHFHLIERNETSESFLFPVIQFENSIMSHFQFEKKNNYNLKCNVCRYTYRTYKPVGIDLKSLVCQC